MTCNIPTVVCLSGMSYENPILQTSIGGIDGQEFNKIFAERSNYSDWFGIDFAPSSYDSIWAAALALNKTVQKMKDKGI